MVHCWPEQRKAAAKRKESRRQAFDVVAIEPEVELENSGRGEGEKGDGITSSSTKKGSEKVKKPMSGV